jgi:hypothetical protein
MAADDHPAPRPRLGLILLDQEHARSGTSGSPPAGDALPPWSYTSPDAWSVPWTAAVAEGARSAAALAAEPAAVEAVARAARRVAPEADLLVGNCGFFWAARERVRTATRTPTLLSSLDMLDLALGATAGDVGVITFSEPALERLLEHHPARSRLRLLGLAELPQWSVLAHDDYMTRDGWSVEGLGRELCDHVTRALKPNGGLAEARLLVLECTVLPYYRPALRKMTSLPVVDVKTIAEALLA